MKNQKKINGTINVKDISSPYKYNFRKLAFLSVNSDVVPCKIFIQYFIKLSYFFIEMPAAKSFDRIFSVSATALLALSLMGCEVDGDDNLPGVTDLGLFMYTEANWHESEDTAQVAAAVYRDKVPIDLVGGDVFEARTTTERVLLKDRGFYAGSYAASLPVDDTVQEVLFNVVHEPVEAREDRWYPVDLVNTDPGPGELVGKSSTVSFPPGVTITGPPADSVYTRIDEEIDLSWVAIGAGDNMRVLAAVECTDGLSSSSYGTMVDIVDDNGLQAIGLDQFIYDLNTRPVLTFIADAALVLLQELLNQLSVGNIDPDYLVRKVEANPINSACEIRLFLQRQRDGKFDITFDDGNVVGSRSAEVTVNYFPPVLQN